MPLGAVGPNLAAGIDGWTILIGVGVLVGVLLALLLSRYLSLWIQAFFTRADVSLFELIGMSLRKVDAAEIVRSKIMVVQSSLQVTTAELEGHYLAGGRVPNVVRAMIIADRARLRLDFETARAIDLAGRDILEAVQQSVLPKVIRCPKPDDRGTAIAAVAKDGIQLRAKAIVTVRTNLERLVGGATEEAIIARVGEGIVSTIGSADSYKSVLQNPARISQTVLQKGLDAGTSFEILSIDVADLDVGENIGAKLQAEQAETDKRIAQASAEKRRAMAVARIAEMEALVVGQRARVMLAEAAVPAAMAEAFRGGRLGVSADSDAYGR